jgi:hypothetical protein
LPGSGFGRQLSTELLGAIAQRHHPRRAPQYPLGYTWPTTDLRKIRQPADVDFACRFETAAGNQEQAGFAQDATLLADHPDHACGVPPFS